MSTDVTYETAGYSEEDMLRFLPGVLRCGPIDDGVGLRHEQEGVWVLSFADLQDMYFRAADSRGMSLEHVGRAYLDFLESHS